MTQNILFAIKLMVFEKIQANLLAGIVLLLILLQGKGYAQSISLPVQRGDIEQVWSFIDLDLDTVDKSGNTILHTTAAKGQIDVIESLIALNIIQTMNIHQPNPRGSTPLHSAARSGREVISQMFIDLGMDINATDHSGETPLHPTARSGRIDIVEVLIAANADLNKRNQFGETPLDQAARNGRNQIVGLLLSHGADVDKSYEPTDYNEELVFYLEGIDDEFLPYVYKYESLKGSPIRNNIRFAFEPQEYLLALCTVKLQTVGIRWILIDPSFWHSSNHLTRESLIFHELGHCDLNREHEDDSFTASIMNTGIPISQPYLLYTELFSKRNTSENFTERDEDEEILKKFNQIEEGMLTFEVLNIIGKPLFVGQREQGEYWRYSFYRHRFWKEIELNKDGQVIQIEEYKIAIHPDI